ncbi:hypothetical protein [Camellia ringspot associated virus 4]|uniref:Uncharacterized protein n=1 Tax=Camellia ringspot associated virus 4 TaxID=2791164 RepID=A0A7S9TQG1_9VIRU|nr:hypothetical protein QKU37_gp6 [Camellia ringspot associated virus 4]QPI34843.1 hypothetical protein [Camellia ringspot associated virus 4]
MVWQRRWSRRRSLPTKLRKKLACIELLQGKIKMPPITLRLLEVDQGPNQLYIFERFQRVDWLRGLIFAGLLKTCCLGLCIQGKAGKPISTFGSSVGLQLNLPWTFLWPL